jgi:hypothetical protein
MNPDILQMKELSALVSILAIVKMAISIVITSICLKLTFDMLANFLTFDQFK